MRSKFELRADRELQLEGYFTDYKARISVPMRDYHQDFFHLYDLMAWKPGELRFISVKGKTCPAKHKRDLATFKLPKGCTSELWMFDRDLTDKRKIRRRIFRYEEL